MPSVARKLPLTYPVLSAGRRRGAPLAVHEPGRSGLSYRSSSIVSKTVEVLVEERDWQPPRPPFARDQIVGLRVAFTDVAVRDRVKQAGGK